MVIEIMIINSKPTFTSNLPVKHIYLYVLYSILKYELWAFSWSLVCVSSNF
jgi:hypothetical protein